MIHPSAVIDPRAELAANVSVAPYSVIGPDVRIGDGTEIGAHVVLEGRVAIGARCRIGHGAVIGGVPQDFKYREGMPGRREDRRRDRDPRARDHSPGDARGHGHARRRSLPRDGDEPHRP